MIPNFPARDKIIQLVQQETLHYQSNIFSILVGKNGTGKSTFLGNLTTAIVKDYTYKQQHHFFEEINYSNFPQQIIAVSTSPFDKFPFDRFEKHSHYTYFVLRDLHGPNFGLAYLSKIIASLIESIARESHQAYEICRVLDYLGYRDQIIVSFQLFNSPVFLEEIVESENIEDFLKNQNTISSRRLNKSFFLNKNGTFSERKIFKLKALASKILYDKIYRSHFTLVIGREGFEIDPQEADDILFLIQCGILRLKDVRLELRKEHKFLSIKDASSGEQSIILSILGIASKIKDGSLIVIDEPEICLHPQWQEKYIEILTFTFQTFKNCHFIIATHSPQIISRLSNINSYIIDMESGVTKQALNFINNSIDYQLANVFDSPGYKNEYLSRIALNIFAKASKRRYFDEIDLVNFDIIEKQSENLDHTDPVYDLYITLKKMKEIYG